MATYNLTASGVSVAQALAPGVTTIRINNFGSSYVSVATGNSGLTAVDTDLRVAPLGQANIAIPLGENYVAVVATDRLQSCSVLVTELAIDPRVPVVGVASKFDEPASISTAFKNFTLANTPNMRAMRSGGVRGRIVLLGDSFLQSYSSGGNGFVGTRPNGLGPKLAAKLRGLGIPARNDSTQGWPSADTIASAPTVVTMANLALVDPRVQYTGCAIFDPLFAPGGWAIQFSAVGDKLVFNPGGTFDTVEILHPKSPSQGNFILSLDGGATTFATISDVSATNDVAKDVISVPQGSTSVTLKKGSALSYFSSISVRQSTAPDIEVINLSVSGTTLKEYATPFTQDSAHAFNVNKALPFILDANAKNLVIINGWYNDRTNIGRTIPQIQADLTTHIQQIKAQPNTDIIYIDYGVGDPALITSAAAAPYRAAVLATCLAQNIPFVDLSAVLTSYADAVNRGLMGDQIHLNGMGHSYTAGLLALAITQPITA